MHKFLLGVALLVTSGCVSALDYYTPNSAVIAHQFVGLDEQRDREQLKHLVGVDPVRIEWCAAFVNAILDLQGIPGSSSTSDYPLMARSFAGWGTSVDPSDIQPGDVVLFPRGSASWQGHVGFYVGDDANGNWIILGGNQDNTVSYASYSPKHAITIRRWQADTAS